MTVKAITSFRWPINGKVIDIKRGEKYAPGDCIEKTWIGQNRAVKIEELTIDERKAKLLDAIGLLEQENEEHWTNNGKPNIHAVQTLSGLDTNRGELNDIAPDIKRPDNG